MSKSGVVVLVRKDEIEGGVKKRWRICARIFQVAKHIFVLEVKYRVGGIAAEVFV